MQIGRQLGTGEHLEGDEVTCARESVAIELLSEIEGREGGAEEGLGRLETGMKGE